MLCADPEDGAGQKGLAASCRVDQLHQQGGQGQRRPRAVLTLALRRACFALFSKTDEKTHFPLRSSGWNSSSCCVRSGVARTAGERVHVLPVVWYDVLEGDSASTTACFLFSTTVVMKCWQRHAGHGPPDPHDSRHQAHRGTDEGVAFHAVHLGLAW